MKERLNKRGNTKDECLAVILIIKKLQFRLDILNEILKEYLCYECESFQSINSFKKILTKIENIINKIILQNKKLYSYAPWRIYSEKELKDIIKKYRESSLFISYYGYNETIELIKEKGLIDVGIYHSKYDGIPYRILMEEDLQNNKKIKQKQKGEY